MWLTGAFQESRYPKNPGLLPIKSTTTSAELQPLATFPVLLPSGSNTQSDLFTPNQLIEKFLIIISFSWLLQLFTFALLENGNLAKDVGLIVHTNKKMPVSTQMSVFIKIKVVWQCAGRASKFLTDGGSNSCLDPLCAKLWSTIFPQKAPK